MSQPTINPPAQGDAQHQLNTLAQALASIAIRIATKGVQSDPIKK